MDRSLRELSEKLRSFSSEEAATWLMEQYPIDKENYGQAFLLLTHRSWSKSDQLRLARYYLSRIPFASRKPYEVFASFMSIALFLKVIEENMPKQQNRIDLLAYHLVPVLEKKSKSDADKEAVKRFLSTLKCNPL